jgi:hypothetical protein
MSSQIPTTDTATNLFGDAVMAALDARTQQNVAEAVAGKANTSDIPEAAVAATSSGDAVTMPGDSISAQGGGGNPPNNIAAYFQAGSGLTTYTNAVGGEKASGISARMNGLPYQLLPVGGAFPASGGVTVTLSTPSGDVSWPLLQVNGNPSLGQTLVGYVHTLSGDIPGTLSITQTTPGSDTHNAGDVYTFTRTVAGTAMTAVRPVPLYIDFAVAHRGDKYIIESGRNNVSIPIATQSVADCVAEVLTQDAAIIAYMSAAKKDYIILSTHNGTGTAAFTAGTATTEGSGSDTFLKVMAVNAARQQLHGRKYLDYRAYLINYGLADEGLTPTSNDTADVAALTVPRALLVDGLHPTIPTRQVIANLLVDRAIELGWTEQPVVTPTAPGQVASVAAVPGDGSVALSWGAPASNGAAITDYTVQYKLSSTSTWSTFAHAASSATSQTVSGLTDASGYDFQIAAVNAIGTGTFSAVISATPVAPLPILGLTPLEHRYDALKTLPSGTEPANGASITTWFDSGTAAESLTRTSGTGVGLISDDGSGRYVRFAIGSSIAVAFGKAWAVTATPRTVIAVLRLSALLAYPVGIFGYRIRQISTGWELSNGTDTIVVAGAVNTWVLLVARIDGANTLLHINALDSATPATAFSPSTSTGSPTGVSLGSGSASTAINADFAVLATVARFISPTELAAVRSAVATSYDSLLP